jgi:nucleotide-binding universal stress UspA family protein
MEPKRARDGYLVVGVDGTEDGDRAVRYAVSEARRTGRTLRLVHVLHDTPPTTPMLLLFQADALRAVGLGVLDDAERRVRTLAQDGVAVEKHLVEGERAAALIAAAGTAPIVLAPRASNLRLMTIGSTTAEVAAHAEGPVVCVPPSWVPGRPRGAVLVGVDGSEISRPVLEAAFKAAEERGDRLTVLHAWRPSGTYEALIGGRVLAESWERQSEPEIWELVAGLRSDFPDVDVQVVLRYARPEVALAEESQHADLLVVGRRGGDRALGVALGSKARALIAAGRCPVEVAPVPGQRWRLPAQRRTSATAPRTVTAPGKVLDPERR